MKESWEKINWHDFLTNDNNPALNRLANKLLQDSEFQRILNDKGCNDKNECVGYIATGTRERRMFSKPSRQFSKSRRKFIELKGRV